MQASAARQYTDTLFGDFSQAREQDGQFDQTYRISGLDIQLIFNDRALAQAITPALQHLQTTKVAEPDLVIALWNQKNSTVKASMPAWMVDRQQDEQWRYQDDDLKMMLQTELLYGRKYFFLLEQPQKRAMFWINDAACIPWWENGSPLRVLLSWWANQHGNQLIHAAAVGTEKTAVLFIGHGGSGKSSCALACLQANMQYYGDDHCILMPGQPPQVQGLYSTAKLKPDNLIRYQQLIRQVPEDQRVEREKSLLFLHSTFGHQMPAHPVPIKAIFAPRVTANGACNIRPISPAKALLTLAPSTLVSLDAGAQSMAYMSDLVKQVPTYEIQLGNTNAEIPELIESYL